MTTPDQFKALYLDQILWGFTAMSSGKEVPGLEERVRKAVADVFRLPLEQQRYPGSVILRGRGSGIGDVRDVRFLRDGLRAWLGDSERTRTPNKMELMGLITRASDEAHRRLAGELGRERVYDLVRLFLFWLGATCEHRRKKSFPLGEGEVLTLCQVCGEDIEDIGQQAVSV